jgi:hypothetical protein
VSYGIKTASVKCQSDIHKCAGGVSPVKPLRRISLLCHLPEFPFPLAPKPFTAQQIQGKTIYRTRYGRVKERGTASSNDAAAATSGRWSGATRSLMPLLHFDFARCIFSSFDPLGFPHTKPSVVRLFRGFWHTTAGAPIVSTSIHF